MWSTITKTCEIYNMWSTITQTLKVTKCDRAKLLTITKTKAWPQLRAQKVGFQWTALSLERSWLQILRSNWNKSRFSIESNFFVVLWPRLVGRPITNSSLDRSQQGGEERGLNKACQEKSSVWKTYLSARAGGMCGPGAVGRLNRACLSFLLDRGRNFFPPNR